MDANGQKRISEVKNRFMKKGLMQKTVANLVAVFFIFSGIPAPVSFASVSPLGNDGTPKNVATLTLDQANAKSVSAAATLPSGVAIQTQSPLSPVQTSVTAYDPSQVTVLPNRPVVGSGVGSGGTVVSGTIQTVQPSSRNIQIQYSNLDSDDFAFVYLSGGTTMDLRNGINVGLNGVSGKKIKLELKDTSGNVASFYLTLQGTFQNYAVSGTLLSSYFPQLDATRIKEVVFVIDRANMDATGTVEIETAGLSFTPVITNPTFQPVTDLSSLRPSASSIEAVRGTTVTSFDQMSPDQYSFTYNLPAGGSQRWAASQIYFPNAQFGQPFNLAAVGGLVLNVSVQGASYYKLEFNDVNGMKVTIRVNVTNGSIFVPDVLLQSAGVVGFESSKIQSIVLVVDDPQATTGIVEVKTKGLLYTPVITGSFYSPSAITQLTNRPVLNASSSFTHGTINLSQTSSHDFTFNYTLPFPSDFVFAYFGNGYFDYENSNVWLGSTMNLTSGVTFAVDGPSGNQLKVEVTDKYGFRAIYYLALAGTLQNYTLNLQGMGIDAANVAQMVFTAEPSKMGSSGMVRVEIKGLSYTPVITGTTPQPVTDLSSLRPSVSPIEPWPVATVSHFTQPSANQFSFDYNFLSGDPSRWAAAQLFFPQDKLLDMGLNGLVLNVNLTGARYYKLEFMDFMGRKVVVRVNVTQGNVQVTSALLHSAEIEGFDPSKILGVVLVVDDPQATTGTVNVSTRGLAYTPEIAPSPELTEANVTTLREVRNLISIADPSGATAQVTQQSSSVYTLSYTMPRFGSWVVGLTAFDDYGTPQPVETQDLRGLGTLVMGLKLASGTGSIKVEFEDVHRNKGIAYLNQVGTTEQFYSIPISEVRESNLQLDLSQIVNINVVVEKYRVDQSSGQLQVRLGGHPYTPVVVGTPYTPGRITPIQNQPVLSSGAGWNEGHSGTINVSQGSPRNFNFNYALPVSGDYVFAYFGNGYFDGSSWTGTSMDLSSGMTVGEMTPALEAGIEFAAKGPAGRKLKVEVVDVTGKRIVFYLDLSDALQNYALRFAGRDIDPTKIAQIIFVAEQLKMGVSGVVEVETRGLAYTPVISSPTLLPLTVFSEQRPSAIAVEAVKGTTVVSFVQTSANDFDLRYDLAAGGLQRWAAGLILFPEGKSFDMRGSGIVLGVDLTGASYYKLEVEDVNGKKITMRVTLTNGKVLVTDALLQSAEVAGFDSSKIHAIVVVVDDPAATTGQMRVSAQGMKYELPVPEGWTRAASNSNFAYKITPHGTPAERFEKLETMDLATGETKIIHEASVIPGQVSYTGTVDVSPDGNTVVAECQGPVQGATWVEIYAANDASFFIQANIQYAGLRSITFSENKVQIHVNEPANAYYEADLTTQEVKFLYVVPEGWTRAASNANYAFKVTDLEMYQRKLEMLDLRTGAVKVVRVALGSFSGSNRLTGWADVNPEGTHVFYITQGYLGGDSVWFSPMDQFDQMQEIYVGRGGMEKIEYLENRVLIYSREYPMDQRPAGIHAVDLITGKVVFTPNVPEGWTRAASNANFAFQVAAEAANQTSGIVDLRLMMMDLRTGASHELDHVQTPDGMILSIMDVSPDGLSVIYGRGTGLGSIGYNAYGYTYQIKARRLDGTGALVGEAIVVRESRQNTEIPLLKAVVFDGEVNQASITTVNKDQTEYTITFDLQTFQIVPSSGWTRAASNANFAFRINRVSPPHATTIETLSLLDLRTGEQTVLLTCGNFSEPSKVALVYDVSPDGALAVFGKTGPFEHNTAFVKNLQTGSQLSFGDSALAGAAFPGEGEIDLAVIHYAGNQLWLREEHRIQADPLEVKGTVYSIQYSGFGVYEDADASLLITPLNATNSFYVFDTTNGTSEMSLLRKWEMSEATYVKFSDAYKLSSGARIISLGCARAGGSYSVLFDALSGRSLELTGEIASVTYEGPVARYGVSQADGTQVIQFVDLNTLQVIPPPVSEGWTRTTSNVNYASKIVYENSMGKLRVKNLITGAEQQIATADHSGGYPASFSNPIDVDPAGLVVIYGISRTPYGTGTYVQKLANAGEKLAISGKITNLVYERAGVLLMDIVKDALPNPGGTAQYRIYYSQEGAPSLNPPVPSGWTRAASNENFGFHVKEEIVGRYTVKTLQVMDLRTGEVRDVVKTEPPVIPTFSRYDVSADGNAVIYEKNSYMHVQKISDPSTFWVGGGIATSYTTSGHLVAFVYADGTRISIDTETFRLVSPTVATPTVTASAPTSAGVVTLNGTRATGTSIWYSLDGGVTYKQLAYASSSTSWSGKITLPVGSTTVFVQARKTVVIAGVTTVLSSVAASVGPITYTSPVVAVPTVTASAPTSAGVVTLTGKKESQSSIWYSLDGGTTYKQLVAVSSSTSWSGAVTLPVGSTTILIQARKIATVSGKSTVILSEAASVGPITYTAPVVAVPTVTASAPTSEGVVTLAGTRAPGTSIWYSIDGGVIYKQLAYSSSSVSWSGMITLPVGSTTVLVQARKTAVVSGVPTVLSSVAASVGPITYTAPVVAVPTVTASAPTAAGVVTLTGTRASGASIWYSLDGGLTYKQLAYSSSYTSWSGKITMPVGSTTVLVQARTTAVVSGVSTVLSSIPVSVGPITYTAPVVAVPTATASVPTRTGVVTLRGTRAAGTSIWYSLDGGITYKQLAYLSSSLSWSGSITVPVGSTTVLVQARTTAIVSGVNTTLSSASVQLMIVR